MNSPTPAFTCLPGWFGLVLICATGHAQTWQAAYDSASVEMQQLRFHKAKPLALVALRLAEQQFSPTDTSYAKTLDVLAEAENRTDQFDDALQHSQAALAIWEQTVGKRHLHYARTLQLVAECYQNRVEYPQAEARHTEALKLIRDMAGENSMTYAVALNRLAVHYRVMGLQAKAIETAEQAKRIYERDGSTTHLAYALILKNLGELHTLYRREFNEPNKAIALMDTALTLIRINASQQTTVYAEGLRTLAVAYSYRRSRLKQEAPSQEPLLREALAILVKISNSSAAYLSCMEELSDYYRLNGQLDQARMLYEQILEQSERINGPLHPGHTTWLFGMYRIYILMGLHRQAEPLLIQCNRNLIREIRLFSTTLSDEEREQLLKNAANGFVWLHTYARVIARHNPAITAEQYDTQLAIKGFLLHADQKFRQRLTTQSDSATRKLYADWQQSRDVLAQAARLTRSELTKRRLRPDSLEARASGLEKQLAVKLQTPDGLPGSGQTSWRDVQRMLKPGEAAVELVRYRTYRVESRPWGPTDTIHYAALIVTPTCAYPKAVILENGNALEGPLLTAYQTDITRQTSASDSYRHFWKPIADALPGVQRVYFSPDGVYHQLSLATLRNPATGQFLLDERDLVLLTSTRDLLTPITTVAAPKSHPTALLLGYPDYGPVPKTATRPAFAVRTGTRPERPRHQKPHTRLNRNGFYEPLPATRQEVTTIGALLRARFTTTVCVAASATESMIKQTQSPTVLHIATHGFFETDTALGKSRQTALFRSGVVLAGANRSLRDTATRDVFSQTRPDDGILTAYEAMNLALDQTELVVLSACQTGLGDIHNGEGVYGLQRAFSVAGARAILMSLWKVDDDVTRQLMTTFYRKWLQNGDKVQAFRLAQQAVRKKYPQPFYWGAFVLVGR